VAKKLRYEVLGILILNHKKNTRKLREELLKLESCSVIFQNKNKLKVHVQVENRREAKTVKKVLKKQGNLLSFSVEKKL